MRTRTSFGLVRELPFENGNLGRKESFRIGGTTGMDEQLWMKLNRRRAFGYGIAKVGERTDAVKRDFVVVVLGERSCPLLEFSFGHFELVVCVPELAVRSVRRIWNLVFRVARQGEPRIEGIVWRRDNHDARTVDAQQYLLCLVESLWRQVFNDL